jgi:hypothetical protein
MSARHPGSTNVRATSALTAILEIDFDGIARQ